MKRQSWFRTALALVGVAGFGLLAAGCTNARVVGVWSDPNRPAGPAGSFLVVSQRKDAVQRRQWEDDVQAQLARSGLRAVSSYTLFPDGVPSQQALDDAMTSQHFDAAIVLKPSRRPGTPAGCPAGAASSPSITTTPGPATTASCTADAGIRVTPKPITRCVSR